MSPPLKMPSIFRCEPIKWPSSINRFTEAVVSPKMVCPPPTINMHFGRQAHLNGSVNKIACRLIDFVVANQEPQLVPLGAKAVDWQTKPTTNKGK